MGAPIGDGKQDGGKVDPRVAEVQKLLTETRSGDGFRLLQIADLASRYGLKTETLEACSRALEVNADPARIEAALRPIAEKEFADLTGAKRASHIQTLLNALGPKTTPGEELYTRLALGALEPAERTKAVERAFAAPSATTRRLAVKMWGAEAPDEKLDPIVKRALCDADAGVRETASLTLAARPNPKITARLTKYLGEASPSLRIRSAEALGNMNQPAAVPALIKELVMLQNAGGGAYAPRAFFFSGTQQAYVADYNVEVAQAAAIAEPVVDTLQSGAVLDVRVLGVQVERVITLEQRAAHDALVKLAGVDLGKDPKAWAKWYANQQKGAGVPTGAGPESRKSF